MIAGSSSSGTAWLQSRKFDPSGTFIRKYVPELCACDDNLIHEPWRMSDADQRANGTVIGIDYPHPIVDHAAARKTALEIFGKIRKDSERR